MCHFTGSKCFYLLYARPSPPQEPGAGLLCTTRSHSQPWEPPQSCHCPAQGTQLLQQRRSLRCQKQAKPFHQACPTFAVCLYPFGRHEPGSEPAVLLLKRNGRCRTLALGCWRKRKPFPPQHALPVAESPLHSLNASATPAAPVVLSGLCTNCKAEREHTRGATIVQGVPHHSP